MAKLKYIRFSSYKKFEETTEIEIKPLTVLIGKNSSGKSSISKLFPMFEKAMSGTSPAPFLFENEGVSLGTAFSDIAHNGNNIGLSFGLGYENGLDINIDFISKVGNQDYWIKKYVLKYNGTQTVLEKENAQGSYIDKDSFKEYVSQDFRGFINFKLFEDKNVGSVDSYFLHTDYIGPFRAFPKRAYSQRSSCLLNKIGIDGTWAYDNLNISNELLSCVSDWYARTFNCNLVLKQLTNGVFSVNIRKTDSTHEINIADEGQGMSQVLPIVTRCCMPDDKDTLIVVEQPELHLHPAAHEAIADLLADTAKVNNHRYVIETHSKNLLLEIRSIVANKNYSLTKDDVVVYYIHDDEECNAILDRIDIDENGNMSDWPEEIFNESYELIKKIRRNAN